MTSVHPAYRRALADAGRNLERQGAAAAAAPGTRRLEVCARGVTLSLLVEEAEPGLVRDARHAGAAGDEAAVVDRLCAVIAGRPLYEAVHHGVIRAEALLRDPDAPPPVAGIVSPRNADPIFALPLELIGALRALVGPLPVPPEKRGAWDDRPAAAWLVLGHETQAARVQAALEEAVRAAALDVPAPEVVEVRDGFRVVLAPREAAHRTALGRALIAIERAVQAALDPRLELQFESLGDRNRRAERIIRLGDHAAAQ